MDGIFNPETFLDAAITEKLVKRPPVKVGVYTAIIGEPKIRTWQGKADPSKSGLAIDVPLELQLPDDEAARVGQAKVTLTGGGFLDALPNGGLDMAPGKNRVLRSFYDATGLNQPGTTPRMLQGRMVKVQVEHEIYEGEPVERVKGVAKA